ncbi:Hypothetical protein R9X50_00569100 [Acrodontium crateriforme]|uniref:Vps72/YL1 C-terminal domain-containing protein n=1 Tax=Acrodontium crateriforme TaxID=150365 RepID=A0AAQ3M8E6_9PEZI|nr:Hypothetical protein R9X50_00569100 [Acrodontium crateriforme]
MICIPDVAMSEDDRSDSGSDSLESDDLSTTGLIATRAKRSTAGNLYSRLRANLDDEELQRELGAQDIEDDLEDYEGGDADDDDDAALDSSSDEEDAGPPKDGEAEDLTGEKEVKKAERAEAKRKRKAKDAKLVVPAWRKKKVKIADDVKTDDSAHERPKKKSERSNWLPTPADMPTRQSDRSLARANREVTHAHLKESAERSEKQRKVMKNAAERERPHKREDLTREQRLAVALKIETQTKKEFGRWEREEKERQRQRDEMLAAKRRRVIYGPIIRYWSGSAIWQGEVMREKRIIPKSHKDDTEDAEFTDEKGDTTKTTQQAEGETSETPSGPQETANQPVATISSSETGPLAQTRPIPVIDTAEGKPAECSVQDVPMTNVLPKLDQPPASSEAHIATRISDASGAADGTPTAPPASEPPANPDGHASIEAKVESDPSIATQPDSTLTHEQSIAASRDAPLLRGIQEYAAIIPQSQPQHTPMVTPVKPFQAVNFYTPSAPSIHMISSGQPSSSTPYRPSSQWLFQPYAYAGWPSTSVQPQSPPPPPLPREQAQRCLVMLDQFDNLDSAMAPKKLPKNVSILEPRELATVLIPESYPSFNSEEVKYLTAKMKKRGIEPPPKLRCALTSWPARFRDPKTGLAYADLQTYKIIQRVLAGGCAWSSLLGAWVGPTYGAMGRPAKGVPPGFASPVIEVEKTPVLKTEDSQ